MVFRIILVYIAKEIIFISLSYRCHTNEMYAYLAYISEGLGNLYDWNMVKKYQMKNGSVFNSPSATAAAFINHQDTGCLNYLTSLLDKFGNAGTSFRYTYLSVSYAEILHCANKVKW